MDFEPFIFRGGAQEAFEIAARMQPLPAPVGGRQERHLDPVPHRRARLVVGVIERMRQDLVAEFGAVLVELLVRKRVVAAHRLVGEAAARAALAEAVLDRLHLHVVPVRPERAEDAAVVRHVSVPVGGAFPDAHGGEVQRLQRGRVPLVDGVIGNAVQADLAARPGLHARPLDALVQVLRLARREMLDAAGRTAGAARVDAQAGVALRHPFLRIDDFPVLIFARRAVRDLRMLVDHALPGARVAVLEGEALGVGPVAEEDRVAAFDARAKQVGAQHQPVVHDDRDVPVDAHAVAELALGRLHARLLLSARFELARRRVSTRAV